MEIRKKKRFWLYTIVTFLSSVGVGFYFDVFSALLQVAKNKVQEVKKEYSISSSSTLSSLEKKHSSLQEESKSKQKDIELLKKIQEKKKAERAEFDALMVELFQATGKLQKEGDSVTVKEMSLTFADKEEIEVLWTQEMISQDKQSEILDKSIPAEIAQYQADIEKAQKEIPKLEKEIEVEREKVLLEKLLGTSPEISASVSFAPGAKFSSMAELLKRHKQKAEMQQAPLSEVEKRRKEYRERVKTNKPADDTK